VTEDDFLASTALVLIVVSFLRIIGIVVNWMIDYTEPGARK
jgi:hypothetical protein